MTGPALINGIDIGLTRLADWLLAPFATAPLAGLLCWSAVAGVVMTLVFGKTSNQQALRWAADQTRAELLAIKLFKDDLGVTFRCQLQLFKATFWRLVYSLVPMLVMAVPFTLVLTQLALRYEHRPLMPGESSLVEMRLSADAWPRYKDIAVEVPAGVVAETEALRDASDHSLCWRIHPHVGRPATLRWRLGERIVTKQLAAADRQSQLLRVSTRRPGAGVVDRLLHPAEPGFSAAGPVRSITVDYPPRQTPLLGLNLPWWATFLIVSILVALLVRRALGVEF
jgi:hypothetical protein